MLPISTKNFARFEIEELMNLALKPQVQTKKDLENITGKKSTSGSESTSAKPIPPQL